jgi:DNA-binding GntR family transcriptional regulator
MSPKKIISHSIREQMYIALKEHILKNIYKPNEVLQIDRIAEEFGVSATPVREALVRLESDGLVTLIPNKGAQVSDISEEDIRNTWEIRRLLETYAARMSIRLIPDEELDDLERDIHRLEASPFDEELYVSTDRKLHQLFFIYLTNNLLKDSITRVHEISNRIRYFAEGSVQMHEKVVQDVIHEHLSIIANIRTHDPELLVPLLYTHLLNGEKRTLEAHNKL